MQRRTGSQRDHRAVNGRLDREQLEMLLDRRERQVERLKGQIELLKEKCAVLEAASAPQTAGSAKSPAKKTPSNSPADTNVKQSDARMIVALLPRLYDSERDCLMDFHAIRSGNGKSSAVFKIKAELQVMGWTKTDEGTILDRLKVGMKLLQKETEYFGQGNSRSKASLEAARSELYAKLKKT